MVLDYRVFPKTKKNTLWKTWLNCISLYCISNLAEWLEPWRTLVKHPGASARIHLNNLYPIHIKINQIMFIKLKIQGISSNFVKLHQSPTCLPTYLMSLAISCRFSHEPMKFVHRKFSKSQIIIGNYYLTKIINV